MGKYPLNSLLNPSEQFFTPYLMNSTTVQCYEVLWMHNMDEIFIFNISWSPNVLSTSIPFSVFAEFLIECFLCKNTTPDGATGNEKDLSGSRFFFQSWFLFVTTGKNLLQSQKQKIFSPLRQFQDFIEMD